MALALSASVFLSVFSARGRTAIEDARRAVAAHQTLLREAERDLQQNKSALLEVKGALQRLSQP